MNLPRIIGLTGHAQHGKDTAGRILVDLAQYKRFAFADTLKSMALALDPYIPDMENWGFVHMLGAARLSQVLSEQGDWESAKRHEEVRRFLQVLGTEGVRDHLGEDAWVQSLSNKMNAWAKAEKTAGRIPRAVITDVRFPNEALSVRDAGGEVWRIRRVNTDGTPFDNGLGLGHPSEQYIDTILADRQLTASDFYTLEQRVKDVLTSILVSS